LKKQLALLEELQKLDIQIYELENEKFEIPQRIEDMNHDRAEMMEQKRKLEAELLPLQEERNERARELDLDRIRMRNLTNKEAQVSNQKEYELYIKELDGLEQEVKAHEAKVKDAEDAITAMNGNIDKVDKELAALDAEIAQLQGEAEAVANRIDKDLDSLYDRRDVIEVDIKDNLLDYYIRVAETVNNGMAISFAQNGSCTACFMKLPPQMFNELLKGDSLHQCPSCRRVLVYRDEIPAWVPREER